MLPGTRYHGVVFIFFVPPSFFFQDGTIAAIVDAADSPLSIVIVGVGQGDFAAMEQLDGDRQRLTSPFTGKVASRDMVQFVPFRDFSGFGSAAQHALAKHVLAEIPGQFIQYMETNKIAPANRRPPGAVLPVTTAQQRQQPQGTPPAAYSEAVGVGEAASASAPPLPGAAPQQPGDANDLPPPYTDE